MSSIINCGRGKKKLGKRGGGRREIGKTAKCQRHLGSN